MKTSLTGTGVALVTPFRPDGSPDREALERLVRFVTQGGVEYLVVLGTTAEVACLDAAERAEILHTVASVNDGRLPLVAGIGGNNTREVARQMREADLQGYQAILSVSPYYNRPTQEGIYRHFAYLAQEAPLPLILYNVPARTGSNMLPDTVARLARDFPSIIAVKEACGDRVQIQSLLRAVPEGFAVLSGDDATAVQTVIDGGVGVISVLGQGIPDRFSDMIRRALSGDFAGALAESETLSPLMEAIFLEGNPAGIKALLSLRGICGPEVRLPLVRATERLTAHMGSCLEPLLGSRV